MAPAPRSCQLLLPAFLSPVLVLSQARHCNRTLHLPARSWSWSTACPTLLIHPIKASRPLPSPGQTTTPLVQPLVPIQAGLTPILQSAVSCILSRPSSCPSAFGPHPHQVKLSHPRPSLSQASHPLPQALASDSRQPRSPAFWPMAGPSLYGQPSPRSGESYTGGCARFHFPSYLYFQLCINSVFPLRHPLLKWGNVISLPRGGGRFSGGWREAGVLVNSST